MQVIHNPPTDAELPAEFHGSQTLLGVRINDDATRYAFREGRSISILDVPVDGRIKVGNRVIVVKGPGKVDIEGNVSIEDLKSDSNGVVKIDTIKGNFTF